MMTRRGTVTILMLTMCGVTGTFARAQEAGRGESVGFVNQQRQAERLLNEQGQRIAPVESLLDWQWGGWLSYNIFSFNDGVQSSRVLQRPELAVWTRLGIDRGAHEIFGRMKLNYAYFDHGDEYDRQQDWIGPNFDRVFYRVDVGRALHLSQAGDPAACWSRSGGNRSCSAPATCSTCRSMPCWSTRASAICASAGWPARPFRATRTLTAASRSIRTAAAASSASRPSTRAGTTTSRSPTRSGTTTGPTSARRTGTRITRTTVSMPAWARAAHSRTTSTTGPKACSRQGRISATARSSAATTSTPTAGTSHRKALRRPDAATGRR